MEFSQLIAAVAPFWNFIQALLAGIAFIFMLLMKSKFVSKDDYAKDKEKSEELNRNVGLDLIEHDSRLKLLENRVDELPTTVVIHELSMKLENLSGELDVCGEKFRGMDKLTDRLQLQVDRMDTFLKGK